MKREKFVLKFDNKTNIIGYLWKSKEEPVKGVVQLSHGMAEHILRYESFAIFLASKGYLVVGHDHYAHGESAIDIEHIGIVEDYDFFDAILKGMKLVYDEITSVLVARYELKNVVLFSHSMGSMAAQRYVELFPNDFSKLILSGTDFGGLLYKFAKIVAGNYQKRYGALSYSDFIQKISIDSFNKNFVNEHPKYAWLSRNEENYLKYELDPYCGARFPVNYFYSLACNMLAARKNVSQIDKKIKILLIVGEEDPVGGFSKSVVKVHNDYLKQQISSSIIVYPKARHELLNEMDEIKLKVYDDVLTFINND